MAKTRVYELAKELNISSKELIDILASEFSIKVKNHMSVLDEEDAELIKEIFVENEESDVVESSKNAKKSIVDEYEEEIDNSIKVKNKKKNNKKQSEEENNKEEINEEVVIEMKDTITVKELADKLNKPITEVIKQLMFMGIMAAINQEIDFNTAEKLAEKFNAVAIQKDKETSLESDETEDASENESYVKRPPVVTIMGHVDHGKTSILDAIKKSKVTSTEAGGITQHIGAYTVEINGEKITFLDTPGHEAFTTMRSRGAQITDIVILVVAADDGIMPQTVEAINHCKAADVPIIVAINKIDKPGANIDKVKQELTEYNLLAEDWGGNIITVPVSAHTKEGLDTLLEMILLTAEMEELIADPTRKAKGTVIEAQLDKGRGPVASLLVQNGTLNVGDSIIVGSTYGRIRAMFDDKGNKINSAGPSIPVEILGLSEVPDAGDRFNVVKDEKTARNMAEARKAKLREERIVSTNRVSLEDLYSQIQEGKVKELDVIVKADVQGSVEAVSQSLEKLSNDSVKVRVIHGAVGAITETDVTLATASNAIIIGFNVRPSSTASTLAEKEGVNIRTYRVIYDAIDDVKSAMVGMLDPEYKEVVLGTAEVRVTYKISNVGTIAGCYVLNGKITRNSSIRVVRDGIVIFESEISSLKRFKDDVKEVAAGYECGITIEKFNDVKEGDQFEAFIMEEIKPKTM
ncbi:translation initiation factor IF-2 [Clostridium homopropionicum DSM 5847]|uniref:Translation initiation factor IF-2 n=1 Tax=Clostridium homopropionicum DSM 5847 TaxID=1121318 RepID=A0A0L6ZD20_9CLOT|nr:translation initiation factor IF-2 [Clostridium homopropionicum]KOA20876.1 translation initiation factor IF-2 [Clostridium homopropionicum DSM 5847]SFG03097.1 translation initiation factor IF-2 [Clostridium homopropionicum]